MTSSPLIERLEVPAFTAPTEVPEGDSTLGWESTTVLVVQPHASDDAQGLGYAFGTVSTECP